MFVDSSGFLEKLCGRDKRGLCENHLGKIKSILSVKILKEEKVDLKTLSKEEGI